MPKQTLFSTLPVESVTQFAASPEDVTDDGEPPSRLRSIFFRRKFYSSASKKQWDDWKWQLANRVTDLTDLSRFLNLSDSEIAACQIGSALPFAITPYYASLIDGQNLKDPLRTCVIPTIDELYEDHCEQSDPLSEEFHEPVPGLVHRYPDRVLFLATTFCSTYCRYCTRSRIVGNVDSGRGELWDLALAYIRNHPEVRDVLVSGGDPLTLSDEALDHLLTSLRVIPHVEIIRIGTKIPTVLPQRVTRSLVKVLKKFHPLFISLHATHPNEFTDEARKACAMLADAGIPLGSQTVLLKGVNDDPATMKRLTHKLLMARVRPYYLYQCDPVKGTSHMRTPVEKGVEIIDSLRGHTTGYAVPTFVIDAPGGGGKIPITANNICGNSGNKLAIRNYEGRIFYYPQVVCTH